MSYFAVKQKERLQKIIAYVETHSTVPEELIPEIMASFGVTKVKANEYVDLLLDLKILRYYERDGKVTKILVKDGRKLEAMK